MDGTQQQIFTLNRKVDQLYDIVERMSHQVMTITSEKATKLPEKQHHRPEMSPMMISDSYNSASYSLGIMEHKDIIQDDAHQGNATGGNDASWSADIQIRRLTAQLTAAYNRIAALEEQLLSYRIHS